MTDYEQLYYDALYENHQLKKQIDLLEQEIQIYKHIQKDKNIKSMIIDDFTKYLQNRKGEKNENNKL